MKEKFKVGFISKEEILPCDYELLSNCDAVLLSNKSFKTLYFKDELSGRSCKLAQLSAISKKLTTVLFVGLKTDNYGIVRQSVAAFYNGKLIGICDAAKSYSAENSPSFGNKLITTLKGKYGIIVGRDICSVEQIKALTICESDAIIDISADFCEFKPELLVPTLAFLHGVPIVFLCGKKLIAASGDGEIVTTSEKEVGTFILPVRRKYREIITKSRGYF